MQVPADIYCAADYESVARQFIAAPVYEHIAGGSGPGFTVEANRAAFSGFDVVPRLLRDLRGGHTRLELLGQEFAHPVLLAPVAFQQLVHADGELESARGADASDAGIVCSTLSSFSLEDIARRAGARRWFQLYFQPRREATLALVERAEAAGYTAIVVTLDTPIQAPSLRALRAGFRLPAELRAGNLAAEAPPPLKALPPGSSRIFQGMMSEAPTWDDVSWLRARTRLPLIAKGVLHPDDARALAATGFSGVVVSNHGGRTLDGVPASLARLPAIREALGPGFPVLFDGGIRSGSDIFKVLALGADAVMVGRLPLYALACAGALGVAHLLRLLCEELESCMALAGCATLADIAPAMVVPSAQGFPRC
jgi:4-hydroxymandelate oxidase